MTIIADLVKSQALDQELFILLAMGVIKGVDPLLQPRGYYRAYFLVPKKNRWLSSHIESEGTQQEFEYIAFSHDNVKGPSGHTNGKVVHFKRSDRCMISCVLFAVSGLPIGVAIGNSGYSRSVSPFP